jgi:multidrug efflux pump subunit AcrA (membrane-fusion protein)
MNGKEEPDANNIQLRSEEVREILGKPPGWLVKWGTAILFLIIVVVITGSSYFSYPDIVPAPVVITKENPPSVLIARTAGKPEVIFFRDGSEVRRNDTLAVMENSARYIDVFRLRDHIRAFNSLLRSEEEITGFMIPGDLVLGEVQQFYNQFTAALHDYRLFVNQDFFEKRIAALTEELNEYASYRQNLTRQVALARRELQLQQTQFARDSLLHFSKVIPISEYEKSHALLLSRQKALEAASLALADAGITIARLERSITDTALEKEERQQALMTNLVNSFRQLESSLASWEYSHLMVAPATGRLNYLSIWSNLQELRPGDAVFSIIPEDMGDLHTRLTVPFRGAGKVRPGQRVNIKLDGYPFMEFGMVEGRIHSVSGAPVEHGFPAVVTLSNGSVTSFGHELEVIRQLPGIAEIITDELSLLERFVSPVRHVMKNRILNQPNHKN